MFLEIDDALINLVNISYIIASEEYPYEGTEIHFVNDKHYLTVPMPYCEVVKKVRGASVGVNL